MRTNTHRDGASVNPPNAGMTRRSTATSSLESVLWILCLIAAACWLWRPIRYANDLWWHLATGRFILTHGYIPKTDVFSWTVRGHRWINHEWLFQILLYLFYKLGSVSGIIALKILLIEGSLAFQWLKMKERGVSASLLWVWLVVMFWASRYGWNERADLVSVFFLSWLCWLMSRYRAAGKEGWNPSTGIWLLALWANSHGGFVMGLAVIFFYVLGLALELPITDVQKPMLWLVFCVAATFLNPNGYQLHLSTIHGLLLLKKGFFTEWQRTPWHPLELFWCSLALYGILMLRHLRRSRHGGWPEGLVGLFLAWEAIHHVRNVPYFMIGAFPDAALWMQTILSSERGMAVLKRRSEVILAAAFLLTGAFATASAMQVRGGINKNFFPIEACDFIQHEHLPGTFYNEDGFGGYWIWRFGEDRPVFLDGRFHTVDGYIDLYKQVHEAQGALPEAWNAFLDRWGIDAALLSYPEKPLLPSVFRTYFPRSRWALIYWDDVALIFVRRTRNSPRSSKNGNSQRSIQMELRNTSRLNGKNLTQRERFLCEIFAVTADFIQTAAALRRFFMRLMTRNKSESGKLCLVPCVPIALWIGWVGMKNRGVWFYLAHNVDVLNLTSMKLIAQNTLWPLALLVLTALIFVGVGIRLLNILQIFPSDPLNLLLCFGTGYGFFVFIIWMLGLVGGYRLSVFLAVGGLASFWAFPSLRMIQFTPLRTTNLNTRPLPTFWRVLLPTIIGISLWHGLITALAPPIEWDALVHHLTIPKLYLVDGVIRTIPWMVHQHWPHLTEIYYGIPLALHHDNLAALFHWLMACFILGWIWWIARWQFDAQIASLATALMAAQTVFLRFSGTAHYDAAFTLLYLLACTSLWKGASDGKNSWFLLGGLLSGFMILTKLIGLVPMGLLALWILIGPHAVSVRYRHFFIYMLGAAVVSAPWFLWTWIAAGNPVWPFLSQLFPDRWGASVIGPRLVANEYWTPSTFWKFMLLYDPEFYWVPFIVLLGVTFFRKDSLPPFIRFMLFPLIPYMLIFGKTTEAGRFIWPMMPGIMLATAWCAVHLLRKGRIKALAGSAVLIVAFIPLSIVRENNALFAVLELQSRAEPAKLPRTVFLERQTDHYSFYQIVSHILKPPEKVLLFQEIRGYYLDCPYQWGDPLNQGLILYSQLRDPVALLDRMNHLGITHVLTNAHNIQYYVNEHYYDRHTLELMNSVLSKYGRLIISQNGLALYAINYPPAVVP